MRGEVPHPNVYRGILFREDIKRRRRGWEITTSGVSNIPMEGPVIFAANHRNDKFDVPALGIASPRQMNFLAKIELNKGVVGKAMALGGVVFIDRASGRSSLEGLDILANRLRQGWAAAIFPEGTSKNRGNTVGELFNGLGKLAIDTGALVVPTGIGGTEKEAGQRPEHVHVAFGEPFSASDLGDIAGKRLMTEVCRQRIQEQFDIARMTVS